MTEIATRAGQKILFSGRGVIKVCSFAAGDVPTAALGKITANNGDTIIT
jgi:hypothetical protein